MSEFGHGVKVAMDDSVTVIGDFDANSVQYEVNSEDMKMVESHADSGGMRGTRSVVKDRVRSAQKAVGGSLVLNPTPIELDTLLPRILGAVEATDVFALAETIPTFGVLIERVTNRFIYTGCYVDKAIFSGSQGQLVSLRLDLLGKTEIVSGTAFPAAVPVIDSAQGYVYADTTYQLAADTSATEVASWSIVIDNMLDPNHYMNSLTRTQIKPTGRMITLSMMIPYDANSVDLHAQAIAGAGGTLTLTNGLVSTLFTFANLKSPANTPTFPQRTSEGMLNLSMRSYMSSTTRELVVTHDSNAAA